MAGLRKRRFSLGSLPILKTIINKPRGLISSRWHRIGRRGAFMITFGLAVLMVGLSMLFDPEYNRILDPEKIVLYALIPKVAWALAFCVSSVLVVLEGLIRKKNDHTISITFLSFITGAWSMGHIVAAFVLDFGRGSGEALRDGLMWFFIVIVLQIVAGWPDYGEQTILAVDLKSETDNDDRG